MQKERRDRERGDRKKERYRGEEDLEKGREKERQRHSQCYSVKNAMKLLQKWEKRGGA